MPKVLSQLKSIPNLLSLLRLLLIPVFLYAYLSEYPVISSVILIVSGLTDLLDGWIARHFHMVTDVGKILDPVADKLTQFAILLCIVVTYPLAGLLVAVFAVKELMMMAGGIVLLKRGVQPLSSKWFGKLATAFFYVSMICVVLFPLPVRIVNVAILINVLLLTFSLSMYILVFRTLKRGSAGRKKA